jgi:hypothetical protein
MENEEELICVDFQFGSYFAGPGDCTNLLISNLFSVFNPKVNLTPFPTSGLVSYSPGPGISFFLFEVLISLVDIANLIKTYFYFHDGAIFLGTLLGSYF